MRSFALAVLLTIAFSALAYGNFGVPGIFAGIVQDPENNYCYTIATINPSEPENFSFREFICSYSLIDQLGEGTATGDPINNIYWAFVLGPKRSNFLIGYNMSSNSELARFNLTGIPSNGVPYAPIYDPSSQSIFALSSPFGSQKAVSLISINTTTGGVTVLLAQIPNLLPAGYTANPAFDPVNHVYYTVLLSSAQGTPAALFAYNTSSLEVISSKTLTGLPFPNTIVGGLAFNPGNGTLSGFTGNSGRGETFIVEIDPQNANVTRKGLVAFISDISSIAFIPSAPGYKNGLYYVATNYAGGKHDTVLVIDPVTFERYTLLYTYYVDFPWNLVYFANVSN